jgi:Kef-type K+ transport system membrane component KefB/mannitol/fructose-specific phosphotransferase system IIA component (Ntr-type)
MYKKTKTIFVFCSLLVLIFFIMPLNALASDYADNHDMTHRMMMLMVQLGLIVFAARLTGILFFKIKLPPVLGELASGIILGAYALGGISLPGFEEGLFPLIGDFPVSPELYAIATIASIVLLFDVGLETDLKMLIKYFFAGSLVGIGGIIASFGMGVWVCYTFAPIIGYTPSSVFDPMCLFLGISSTATSVGITARILSEKKKLDSPEGVTILSAAVIDDVLGIILLAVVTGIYAVVGAEEKQTDWSQIGIIGFKAVFVWLVATAIGIMASRRISILLKLFGGRTSISIMAFGLALILAGLFEMAGLAMIIGAYVMGLSLSKSDIMLVVREKLHTIYALLVPIFFCVTGMMIDLKAMTDPQVLLFASIYSGTAMAAKFFGCGLPALLANFNLLGAVRVGAGMTPRGEVGLIIGTLGLSSGMLNEKLFAAIIIMVVVNTVVAPPVLVALFKNGKSGVKNPALETSDKKHIKFYLGTTAVVEMFISKLTDVLEEEGFYTHLLSRPDRLYQARKENVVIEYRQTDTELEFSCQARDIQFIKTAVLDAAASVENVLKNIKEPINNIDFGTNLYDVEVSKETTASFKRRFSQILKPGHIKFLSSSTKEEVIVELLSFLCDTGQFSKKYFDKVKEILFEREDCLSTGFSDGLAMPHARVDCISQLVCVVGFVKKGIDFNSLDGKPSHFFVLTLSPKDKPAPHLEFIAMITGAYQKCSLEKLQKAKTPEELHSFLVN